jgi:uncharacterized protein involved in exopolysaccharide biosynthesis
MSKNKQKFNFNSTDFISYIWSKKKVLVLVSFIAGVISVIFSMTITPKYRSSVVLFPASSGSVSRSLLSSGNSQDDLLKFGTEQEGEQLMQVLSSSRIKEKIIHKYNLIKHYKIDTTAAFWKTTLSDEFNGNIKFRRTEFMSVIIDVLDINPDTAAIIANEISDQVDTIMSGIQHDRAQKALALVEKEYMNMVGQMNEMEDSLKRIRQLGVIDYKTQSKALNEAYAKAIAQGRTSGARIIENKLKILAQYGGAYVALSELLRKETKRLSELKGKYMECRMDAEQTIPHKFVVDKAYPSEKKAYPKRSFIVLISVVSAFFMTLLVLILWDSISYKIRD